MNTVSPEYFAILGPKSKTIEIIRKIFQHSLDTP